MKLKVTALTLRRSTTTIRSKSKQFPRQLPPLLRLLLAQLPKQTPQLASKPLP